MSWLMHPVFAIKLGLLRDAIKETVVYRHTAGRVSYVAAGCAVFDR
jgi:hypothetical protein